jgi:hypothetical protein
LGFEVIHVNRLLCILYPTFNTKTQQYCSVLTIYDEVSLCPLATFSLCINGSTVSTLFTSMLSYEHNLILESFPTSTHCGYYTIDLDSIKTLFTKQHRYINLTPIYTLPQPMQDYKQTLVHNKNISKDFSFSLQINEKQKLYIHKYPVFLYKVNGCYFYNLQNVYNYIHTLSISYTIQI